MAGYEIVAELEVSSITWKVSSLPRGNSAKGGNFQSLIEDLCKFTLNSFQFLQLHVTNSHYHHLRSASTILSR